MKRTNFCKLIYEFGQGRRTNLNGVIFKYGSSYTWGSSTTKAIGIDDFDSKPTTVDFLKKIFGKHDRELVTSENAINYRPGADPIDIFTFNEITPDFHVGRIVTKRVIEELAVTASDLECREDCPYLHAYHITGRCGRYLEKYKRLIK